MARPGVHKLVVSGLISQRPLTPWHFAILVPILRKETPNALILDIKVDDTIALKFRLSGP